MLGGALAFAALSAGSLAATTATTPAAPAAAASAPPATVVAQAPRLEPPAAAPAAAADAAADDLFLDAREAARTGNRAPLAAAAARLRGHVLYPWIDYWQLQSRVAAGEASADEIEAFHARYPDSYLGDRLRADRVLALGARGDLAGIERESWALAWMHEEPQLRCWIALARYRAAPARLRDEQAAAARRLLALGRDGGGEGCMALGSALIDAGALGAGERVRMLVEQNQVAAARRLAAGLDPAYGQAIAQPVAWLRRNPRPPRSARAAWPVAVARLAREQPEEAARFAAAADAALTPAERGAVWGRIGHMAAYKQLPEAVDWYRRGGEQVGVAGPPGWLAPRADEVLEWQVRAALRGSAGGGPDWAMVREAIGRMPPELQREPAWRYWQARALLAGLPPRSAHAEAVAAGAPAPADGIEPERRLAWATLRSIAEGFDFYGQLAAEELGLARSLPATPPPPDPAATAAFAGEAGFARARKLCELGMRPECAREWSWALRRLGGSAGLDDAALRAAAEHARRLGLTDRMIATSERTRTEIDLGQRFPQLHRERLAPRADALGLDEPWVFGLIRQESRFVSDAKSSSGALGLMQLMPATARYVARRISVPGFHPDRITEIDLNLQLGTTYLRTVLDDLDGSVVLATAAYNAGPRRARTWRSTLPRPVEGAIFAETIPFNETRDYVKRVMANAGVYALILGERAPSLKRRLATIQPRPATPTDVP